MAASEDPPPDNSGAASERTEGHFGELRFAQACQQFPPLARLLDELEGVSDTGDRREALVGVSRALYRFVLALPHQQVKGAAASLVDLIQAIGDTQNGKRSPLFEPTSGVRSGRLELNSISWGKDLISSAVAYLVDEQGRSLKDAIEFVRIELKQRGYVRKAKELRDIHEHRANKRRGEGSPDFRHAIESDAKLKVVLDQAAKLLREPGG